MAMDTDLRCVHCDHVFRRASTLTAHVCEPRRRHQARNERGVQIGFQAFLAFYQELHGSSRLKTLDDFDTSSYYRAFVKFGRYCVNTRVIDPDSYLRWLLQQRIRIDHWARDREYTQFLTAWLPSEPVAQALTRGQDWAQDWAQTNHSVPQHCLRYGNTNAICHAIVTGRVSAWLIYNSTSGQEFLANLPGTMLDMIWCYVDSDRWLKTFQDRPADQIWCREQLDQAGW